MPTEIYVMGIRLKDMSVIYRKLYLSVFALVFGALQVHIPLNAAAIQPSSVAIATQLASVQHGRFAGKYYLTLKIRDQQEVGPTGCRSDSLRLNLDSEGGRRDQIEAIAISAMLSSDVVMIVLPADGDQCVEGKPAFTDIYPLPSSL